MTAYDRLLVTDETGRVMVHQVVYSGWQVTWPPWVAHQLASGRWRVAREVGWSIAQEPDTGVAPEEPVNWRSVAEQLAEVVEAWEADPARVTEALDRFKLAVMQEQIQIEEQQPVEEQQGPKEITTDAAHAEVIGHEHDWPADLDADAECQVEGCTLTYGEWSEGDDDE